MNFCRWMNLCCWKLRWKIEFAFEFSKHCWGKAENNWKTIPSIFQTTLSQLDLRKVLRFSIEIELFPLQSNHFVVLLDVSIPIPPIPRLHKETAPVSEKCSQHFIVESSRLEWNWVDWCFDVKLEENCLSAIFRRHNIWWRWAVEWRKAENPKLFCIFTKISSKVSKIARHQLKLSITWRHGHFSWTSFLIS